MGRLVGLFKTLFQDVFEEPAIPETLIKSLQEKGVSEVYGRLTSTVYEIPSVHTTDLLPTAQLVSPAMESWYLELRKNGEMYGKVFLGSARILESEKEFLRGRARGYVRTFKEYGIRVNLVD